MKAFLKQVLTQDQQVQLQLQSQIMVQIGDKVSLDFTSGSAADGDYIVTSAVNQNTFTILTTASGTTSGNVDLTMSGQRKFVCESFTKNNSILESCCYSMYI